MAKLIVPAGMDNLPLWDSFEAIFFIVAGISVGVVLGVLFPSLWRTFRRNFRKQSHYTPFLEKWEKNSELDLQILKDENDLDETTSLEKQIPLHVNMIEAFMMAHHFFQTGRIRNAIQIYLEILGNENVSKQETNRALFELSQIYLSMGLHTRAFDTAFELLNRKPTQEEVLRHILKIGLAAPFSEKFIHALSIYKGSVSPSLRKTVAHFLSQVGQTHLEKNELSKAMEFARLAVNWDRSSARALILLWEITNRQSWQKNTVDAKMMWVAVAAALDARAHIYLNTKVSPAVGSRYLSFLIDKLCHAENVLENYAVIENEFQKTLTWKKLGVEGEKKLLESIFYAIILLQDSHELNTHQNLNDVLSILTNKKKNIFYKKMFLSEKPSKAEIIGFFAHHCEKCQSQFISFAWKCPHCAAEESLVPVLSPLLE